MTRKEAFDGRSLFCLSVKKVVVERERQTTGKYSNRGANIKSNSK